ncbi:MAG: M16 family metallopeptidase [Candidatus Brocadiales bacterium]
MNVTLPLPPPIKGVETGWPIPLLHRYQIIFCLVLLVSTACNGEGITLNYQKKTLSNGLRVILVEHHELPVVAMELMIKAGSALDPADRHGLAHLTSSLLLEGTAKKTAQELSEEIEFIGGTLRERCGYDCTTLSATSLKKDLPTLLGLLSQVVLSPSFPEEELERHREEFIASILREKDDRKAVAERHMDELLFGNHPYGHPPIGTPEGLKVITRFDVVEFHKRYYLPNNSVLAVVGDFEPAETLKVLEGHMGGWRAAEVQVYPSPALTPRTGRRIRLLDKPDLTQTEIRLGLLGSERKSQDFFPLLLLNHILASGPSSRLYAELRAKRGLTYGVNGRFYARKERGPFFIRTHTRNETTLEALQLLLKGLEQVRQEGISQEELDDARAYHTGSFPLGLETPAQTASQLLEQELYGLPDDYLETYLERLGAVTLEEVNQLAKRVFTPDNRVIVLVGKASEVLEQIQSLGAVELKWL